MTPLVTEAPLFLCTVILLTDGCEMSSSRFSLDTLYQAVRYAMRGACQTETTPSTETYTHHDGLYHLLPQREKIGGKDRDALP
jgi:hypothetical protein